MTLGSSVFEANGVMTPSFLAVLSVNKHKVKRNSFSLMRKCKTVQSLWKTVWYVVTYKTKHVLAI